MTRSLTLLAAALVLAAAPLSGVLAAESPAELVRAEVAAVLAVVKDESLSASERHEKVTQRIATRFDFDAMAQSILSTHWKDASEEERATFVALFQRQLEKIYVTAIESHTTEVVRVGGERFRDGNATVIVTIMRDDRSDVPLLFKLKPEGSGWIVYDANVEGLSLVAHYRDSLGAIAARDGMAGVLAHLEEKVGPA